MPPEEWVTLPEERLPAVLPLTEEERVTGAARRDTEEALRLVTPERVLTPERPEAERVVMPERPEEVALVADPVRLRDEA